MFLVVRGAEVMVTARIEAVNISIIETHLATQRDTRELEPLLRHLQIQSGAFPLPPFAGLTLASPIKPEDLVVNERVMEFWGQMRLG